MTQPTSLGRYVHVVVVDVVVVIIIVVAAIFVVVVVVIVVVVVFDSVVVNHNSMCFNHFCNNYIIMTDQLLCNSRIRCELLASE